MKHSLLKFRAWPWAYQLEYITPAQYKYIARHINNFGFVMIFKGPERQTAFRLYLKGWRLIEENGKYWLQQKPPQLIRLNVEPVDIDPVKIIATATAQLAQAFNVPLELVKPKKIKHRWKYQGKSTVGAITRELYQCTRCPMRKATYRTFDNNYYVKYFDADDKLLGSVAGECPDTTNPNKTKKPI